MVRTYRRPALGWLVLFVAVFLAWAPAACAQGSGAGVSGQVLDASGAAVSGASVNMLEVERGVPHTATTDGTGLYVMPNLPVGDYRLEVTKDGFKSHIQSGITLQVSDQRSLNVTLQVGEVSQSVEVTAAASMVQTASSSISQVVDDRRMVELPLNGRQATQLVLLSGAAVTAMVPNQDITTSKTVNGAVTISVAGGQATGTNYLLDGGSHIETAFNVNLPFPFPDALQEFSVETNSLPARSGSQPGGVVNALTKSGSNELHGSMFEFLRNGAVNARNYFAPVHDSLKRNQFGGTLGGKIIQDRMFFFGGYQGTRIRQNPPQTVSYVPTAAARAGDFSVLESGACQSSGKARVINDPLTGKPFPNSQIPVSRFDPAAVKLMSYLPATSNPCGKVTYGIPSMAGEDQGIGRIDWAKSDKHSIFGRYFIVGYRNPAGDPTGNLLITTAPGNMMRTQAITIGDTYTFNATTVNSLHATFNRVRNNRSPNEKQINARTLGVNSFVNVPNDLYVVVSNAFNIGCNTCSPGFFNVNTYHLDDDVMWMHGRHEVAFGASVMRTQNNLLSGFYQNGMWTFSGSVTGDSMADLMLGAMSGSGANFGFVQSKPQPEALRQTLPALYVQDTFRATPRLVVNAGLRWEPYLFPVDYFHRGSTFSMADFLAGKKSKVYTKAPVGTLYYGDEGVAPGFTKNAWAHFSPRLGVVWDPTGTGKQTIRAGGGILYDAAQVFYAQRVMSNPPFVNEIDLYTSAPGGFSDPWNTGYRYKGGNPFPGVNPPPKDADMPLAGLRVILPPDIKSMYSSQWNLTYERQISDNLLGTFSYIGNKTTHVWTNQQLNPAVYIPGTCNGKPCSTTSNTDQRKLLTLLNPKDGPYYGSTVFAVDGGNANYNALLASLRQRFSHGFTMLANYTWSHCISDQDFRGDITSPNFMNPSNLRQDRASCAFDTRHVFNLSGVAMSHFGGRSWTNRLLGNWQLAPLLRVTSGIPLNVVSGKDNSLTAVNLDRPNLVSPNAYTGQLGAGLQWLNPASFAQNALGTFGNLGRNSVTGPSQFNFDVALTRSFSLSEKWHLDARAEAFNVLNKTVFSPTLVPTVGSSTNTSLNLSSASFGRIVAAQDPRILQFALKLMF